MSEPHDKSTGLGIMVCQSIYEAVNYPLTAFFVP